MNTGDLVMFNGSRYRIIHLTRFKASIRSVKTRRTISVHREHLTPCTDAKGAPDTRPYL